MAETALSGVYTDGDAYEKFMGRWSSASGADLVRWLDLPDDLKWLDVGCGTGSFTNVILKKCAPRSVTAIDPSEAHIRYARSHIFDPRVAFGIGDGQSLPLANYKSDAAVAALVLNFVSDPGRLISEMKRVVRPTGTVAAYVWDFEGGMNVSQHIWEGVAATNPDAPILARNEERIKLGRPETLSQLFEAAGLRDVTTLGIDITVTYQDFDDYWKSNDTTTSPIGRYIDSLSPGDVQILKQKVENIITKNEDGGIQYGARSYAVRGLVLGQ